MSGRTNLKTSVLVAAFSLAIVSTTFAGRVIYVDADTIGANNGSSWANAYNYVQDALAAASSGDEIRVAQGIYKPDQGTGITPGDREATFQLINGVALKGGYAGFGEPDTHARDIDAYETILSGDLADNDIDVNDPYDLLNDPCRAENSYHVVTSNGINSTAVLDGFTITGGNADGSWMYNTDKGGGLCNYTGSPTVINCTFSGNSATYGGGMHSRSGRPTLTNCTFTRNSAETFGGGLGNWDSNSPTLTDCTFIGNSAMSGGGMSDWNSSLTLTNCSFNGNSADHGGGMSSGRSVPKLIACTFTGNTATYFGGGISTNESSPIIINCIFSGNSAGYGGVMENWGSSATLTNCTFTGNTATYYGGGVYNEGGRITPVHVVEGGNLTLTNCTFAENSAAEGNAIACDSMMQVFPSDLQVTNCIFWDDGDEIWNNDESTIAITYSDVESGWPGEGNFEADPCFVDPGYWDAYGEWFDGDYHLLPDSPCINAGDPNHPYDPNETDLDGEPRVIGGRIDVGAYEYRPLIQAEARIIPHTINLASKGKWITCYIWLPKGYDVADIDSRSLLLESQIQPVQFWVNEEKQVAMARFNRSEVQGILDASEVELTITGQLTDGTIFEAKDVIIVINKGSRKSAK